VTTNITSNISANPTALELPSSQDEVTSFGHSISWDTIRSVSGTPADGNSAPIVSPSQFKISNSFRIKTISFFTELKRRNVYKVAVAYTLGSWLLIQAASIFLPTFDAPAWMMKAVVVFLALGFILSAILSWVFDITPQGIKRTANISPDEALDIVRQLEAQARQEFVLGYLSALIYAGLGDKTKAIDYLRHEFLNHDNSGPTGIRVDAILDRLCSGPRFDSVADKTP
jgi:hypothetical protein